MIYRIIGLTLWFFNIFFCAVDDEGQGMTPYAISCIFGTTTDKAIYSLSLFGLI